MLVDLSFECGHHLDLLLFDFIYIRSQLSQLFFSFLLVLLNGLQFVVFSLQFLFELLEDLSDLLDLTVLINQADQLVLFSLFELGLPNLAFSFYFLSELSFFVLQLLNDLASPLNVRSHVALFPFE